MMREWWHRQHFPDAERTRNPRRIPLVCGINWRITGGKCSEHCERRCLHHNSSRRAEYEKGGLIYRRVSPLSKISWEGKLRAIISVMQLSLALARGCKSDTKISPAASTRTFVVGLIELNNKATPADPSCSCKFSSLFLSARSRS